MKRYVLIIVALFILILTLPDAQASNGGSLMPYVTTAMQQAEFWVGKLSQPDQLLMNRNQIAAFNQQTAAQLPDTVYDLRRYPIELNRDKLAGLVQLPGKLERSRYVNGRPPTSEYYAALAAQCNRAGIAAVTPVRYGFTVTRANMRTFPTADRHTGQADDTEFDLMQETAFDPAEPLIILHHSTDQAWFFVQTINYRGWLPASTVAVAATRQEWLAYQQSTEFLTVIANKLKIDEREFAMGARLPLADRRMSSLLIGSMAAGGNYVVSLPVRGSNGQLAFELAAVASDNQVVEGALPYTRANVIRQVFKLQGERYGWGGLWGGWDCSSLVLDVYRTFGFVLPRNADEQESSAGSTVNFASGNRSALLRGLEAGAAVYMPGHTMIYLGEHDGRQYCIHALGGYSTPAGRVPVMRVVVSDLSLTLRNGTTFFNALNVGKKIQ